MTYGKLLRRLCGTVLIMEAVVLLLTIVPAIKFEHLNGGTAGGLGAGLAVAGLVLGGMVGRPGKGWALIAGSVYQGPSSARCGSPASGSPAASPPR
jgi:hypothetical protein